MTFKPVENPVVVVKLEKPISYLGVEIKEIAIREPTGGDIFRVGTPVDYDPRFEPPKVTINEAKAFPMLSRLTGIPIEGSLERMLPNDTVECFWGMARFFIPGLLTRPPARLESSPDITTDLL